MHHNLTTTARCLCVLAWLTIGVVLCLQSGQSRLFVAYADPVGVKFTGSGACAAAACHGAVVPGNAAGDHAVVIWNDKDPHSKTMLGKVLDSHLEL